MANREIEKVGEVVQNTSFCLKTMLK